jgi:hypothetical protein
LPERVVIRGGHVLSMDPGVGDLHGGGVPVDEERIAAVGHPLDLRPTAPGARYNLPRTSSKPADEAAPVATMLLAKRISPPKGGTTK